MGIHGLMKLISEEAPGALKEKNMENFNDRKVAIDASMALYQFMIAVRSSGPGDNRASTMLTNEAGEVTSHIQGIFNRTIKMMESGVKPVYVFDGKPPNLKGGELAKRLAKREKAESDLAEAKESGEVDDIDKFSRRLVKVTKQHNEDCKELLKLMGIPFVNAPCEAEAQCAELTKKGKVFATATEDMDALTFRTPELLRRFTSSQGKDKLPIIEVDFQAVLDGLQLTYEEFVDLCILCGCDYCDAIKGIGPKTALKLIRQHHCIENIVDALKREKKYDISEDWEPQTVTKNPVKPKDDDVKVEAAPQAHEEPISDEANPTADVDSQQEPCNSIPNDESAAMDSSAVETEVIPPLYVQARMLFLEAEVTPGETVELKWEEPKEAELKAFLVDRMGFNPERVANGISKLQAAARMKSQKRMDSFFQVLSSSGPKRKAEEVANLSKAKKGKVVSAPKKGGPA